MKAIPSGLARQPRSKKSVTAMVFPFDGSGLRPAGAVQEGGQVAELHGQQVVLAILDAGRPGVAEQLLDRILTGQPVAAEELDSLVGHLEGEVGAGDLR